MIWISFFPGKDYHRMPIDGQKVIYYGEPIGVWRGTYKRVRDDICCEHLLLCGESGGVVDIYDAPFWQPDEGQDKPQPPEKPYPDGYPSC